ncbi:MAG: ribosomal protein L9, large subunit ribosomal protein L9 [Candidatus Moranbacteria bacterium GW2011_GWC1_45_18]|nr:MAG: 50S ribosomal protein L9 [Candidatus Moranbacteria bacterium GW2011_GWC2_40_12]KKT34060.1 MAG: 50S ribosomal protein L9 [Candidatus Moranbacteria bacterium GW2011_GWF2_44_10]KKU00114.1 MAG: ribosomal protein L9, large subunit ribosomal protein L9 [Candidatus Moranbacteria bacterium GW2011_GWC1_45_18]OGI34789.1 MAG: 50S ribosomal protein L9 [Candidatus Moranbacteria bacterium RIFOXYC1_FULL_44_8]OGI39357.1 MAG: 50S ribosomal protein L9 [Candidatus Moranbacteria bacterium RIFOXYB1_FULL_44_
MKVILTRNVDNLGKEGEVKEVADGFARNFLFPKKMAEPATDAAIKNAEDKTKKKAESAKLELEEAQKLAEQLEGRELYVKVKETEGKLFGSVNEKTIAKTFKDEGIEINSENIKLLEPIKEMGEYDAQISLNHGLEANIRIILVGEEKTK